MIGLEISVDANFLQNDCVVLYVFCCKRHVGRFEGPASMLYFKKLVLKSVHLNLKTESFSGIFRGASY